jgi:hypothetical protein
LDPAAEIPKAIDSEGIDLVTMGTHGRKSLEQTLFGSVAGGVVKKSPALVMIVDPHGLKDKQHFFRLLSLALLTFHNLARALHNPFSLVRMSFLTHVWGLLTKSQELGPGASNSLGFAH